MSEKVVEYGVDGDASKFASAMNTAADAAKGSADKIKSHFDQVSNAFEQVQKKLFIITAIVGGGSFFKEAISEANKLTGETMSLAKRLGISAEEAGALNTALGDIGSDSETYIGAFDKFAKQLKTNEQGLVDMGIKTRDANGHLRDSRELFQEALQVVGQFKPGLDQTTAAMELFGKGVDDAMKLQKLNNDIVDDAKKKNEELGLSLTQEGVEATKAYKAAMNDVGDVLTAVQVNIGRAVMPVFAEMGNYFASTGPYVVEVFKVAVTGLLLVFRGLQWTVQTVMGVIFEQINMAIDQFGLLGELMAKVFSGDFKGAADVWDRMKDRYVQGIRNVISNSADALKEAQGKFSGDFERVWGEGTAVKAPKAGTRQQGAFKTGDEKEKKAPSFMSYYEAQLEEEKRVAAERDALHGLSKEAELKYWEDLLQYAQLTEADKVNVAKKASAARIEVLRETAQREQQLGALATAALQARLLGDIDAEEAQASLQVQLGRATQEQLLAQQLEFEERRARVKRAALEGARAALDPERDPVQIAQINNQLEALEIEHQAKLQQIRGQVAVQQNAVWTDLQERMSGLWDKGLQAMMNGTLTWRSAMRAVFTELSSWFATAVVGDMVKKWLAGKAAQLAASVMGATAEKSVQTASSSTTAGVKLAEADAVISANATEAASGAAASQAAIPVVGPGLAMGAFAAIMALVLGARALLPSARGGFDIPSGVNPLTQLHEREMVLPAAQADVIRGLAGQGVQAPAPAPVQLAVHPMPGNFFMVNRDALVNALGAAHRDNALGFLKK